MLSWHSHERGSSGRSESNRCALEHMFVLISFCSIVNVVAWQHGETTLRQVKQTRSRVSNHVTFTSTPFLSRMSIFQSKTRRH